MHANHLGLAGPKKNCTAPSAPDSASYLGLAEASHDASRQYGATVAYRRLWLAVIAGEVPARRLRGRWYVAREDLPLIARVLGVAAAPEASAAHFGLTKPRDPAA
jgi:hypothetical protein